jgi:LEA14-like dessication related protein
LPVVNKALAAAVAGGAGIAIAAVIIFVTGPFQLPGMQTGSGGGTPQIMQDVVFSMNSLTIKEVSAERATIEVAFDLVNPNRNTLILEEIQYDLRADGVSVAKSRIGERLEGMIAGTGQTYYLVPDTTLTLKDTVQVSRTKVLEPVWGGLQGNDAGWRITGVYVITDPVRTGGQERPFDFTLR